MDGPVLDGPALDGPVLARSAQAATYAHLLSLAGAFAFWVWLDRGLWFFGDEWDFLVQRGIWHLPTNPASIWFPHNEHWSTLPILLWRALFNVFHLGSYWPYIIPVLVLHVGIMHLCWRLSRRAGVPPWVAVAAVGLLGFLGAGAENLTWAFQVGFVGSVFFGLLALDLLDGCGPVPRSPRLLSAGVALVASLMCSTIGDAMVVAAAVLAIARLQRKQALWVIGAPVAAYATWFALVGRLGISAHSDRFSLTEVTGVPAYIWTGLSSALGQTFNLASAGGALLVGVGVWAGWLWRDLWARRPALLGLCAAVVAFYTLAALGRDTSTVDAGVSRYVYIAVALLVPVMGKLLSPARASTGMRLCAAGLLALTALGDVGQAQSWATTRVALTSSLETEVLATARLLGTGVQFVSGPGAPPIGVLPDLTAGPLRHFQQSHLLPDNPVSTFNLINARTALAVGTWNGSVTALTRHPLSTGRFTYQKATFAVASSQPGGCLTLAPESTNPVQVWLHVQPGQRSASLRVVTPPAATGTVNYLAAVLVPLLGPTTSVPVELVVPHKGKGYLSDNDPQAELVITWNVGTPLTLCDLSGPL
jgi:hypothetical protein